MRSMVPLPLILKGVGLVVTLNLGKVGIAEPSFIMTTSGIG